MLCAIVAQQCIDACTRKRIMYVYMHASIFQIRWRQEFDFSHASISVATYKRLATPCIWY